MRAWRDSKWVRGVAFVALNLGGLVLAAMLLVAPVRDALDRRDGQIMQQHAVLAQLKALAAQEPAVQAAAKQLPTDGREYLADSNDGVINANLQTRLKGMVEGAGARLRAARTLPSQGVEGTKYLGSRVEIYGTLPAVHRAIAAIESGKPYLFVRAAAIKPAPSGGRPDAHQEPVLEAQLDVFGAVRSAASER